MDRINKWYIDSYWKYKKDLVDQKKIIREVAKEIGLKVTFKTVYKKPWYSLYCKANRIKTKNNGKRSTR